jgi:hypothetical protein
LLCDSEIRRPQEKKNKSSKENSYVDRLWWPLRSFPVSHRFPSTSLSSWRNKIKSTQIK